MITLGLSDHKLVYQGECSDCGRPLPVNLDYGAVWIMGQPVYHDTYVTYPHDKWVCVLCGEKYGVPAHHRPGGGIA